MFEEVVPPAPMKSDAKNIEIDIIDLSP